MQDKALHPTPVDFEVTHHEVFRREDTFAGWPANYGLWSWGQELLVVFAVGKVGPKGQIHELDRDHPFVPCQARSMDGGKTWSVEEFDALRPGGTSLSADEHLANDLKTRPRLRPHEDLLPIEQPIDFFDPETIVMCGRTGLSKESVSWFYVCRSRGAHWEGPFAFRGLDLPIAARTDIVPLGSAEALFMLTTSKSDGKEGRTFCGRTRDGGRTFDFVSFVGDEPDGYRIMPSSAKLADGSIVTAVRCWNEDVQHGWIETLISKDAGATWAPLGVAAENTGKGGNPPALLKGDNGRLMLAYGFRDAPYGIRMRASCDGGRSWTRETILRCDGGTPDLGYPRIARVTANQALVVYYFNDGERGERYLVASAVRSLG